MNRQRIQERHPNFVFILVDDVGWNDMGYNGSTFYDTPCLDRFAAESMRFDASYAVSPMCSPTRASIITGKCPPRTGITQYISGWRCSKFRVVTPLTSVRIADDEVTLAEAFKEHGYHTAFMGKWHMGSLKDDGPKQRGFDVEKAVIESNRCAMSYPFAQGGYFEDAREGDYFTDKLTDEAVSFLKERENGESPFLLYLSHFAMHSPIKAKDEDRTHYEQKRAALPRLAEGEDVIHDAYSHKPLKRRQDDPDYAGELKNLDENIGRLLDALKESGLDDNTVVIFVSDNGGRTSFWRDPHPTATLPLRGGKTFVFEGGIRVPMIVRWPGVTKPGSVCTTPVTSTDFYPTMLDMAGLPLKPEQHMDGVSLVPLFRGEEIDRKYLFWHFPHYQAEGAYPASAVRYKNHKLVRNYHFDDYQLFDIEADPYEERDIIEQEAAVAETLKGVLDDWFDEVGAKIPQKNTSGEIIDDIQERYRDDH